MAQRSSSSAAGAASAAAAGESSDPHAARLEQVRAALLGSASSIDVVSFNTRGRTLRAVFHTKEAAEAGISVLGLVSKYNRAFSVRFVSGGFFTGGLRLKDGDESPFSFPAIYAALRAELAALGDAGRAVLDHLPAEVAKRRRSKAFLLDVEKAVFEVRIAQGFARGDTTTLPAGQAVRTSAAKPSHAGTGGAGAGAGDDAARVGAASSTSASSFLGENSAAGMNTGSSSASASTMTSTAASADVEDSASECVLRTLTVEYKCRTIVRAGQCCPKIEAERALPEIHDLALLRRLLDGVAERGVCGGHWTKLWGDVDTNTRRLAFTATIGEPNGMVMEKVPGVTKDDCVAVFDAVSLVVETAAQAQCASDRQFPDSAVIAAGCAAAARLEACARRYLAGVGVPMLEPGEGNVLKTKVALRNKRAAPTAAGETGCPARVWLQVFDDRDWVVLHVSARPHECDIDGNLLRQRRSWAMTKKIVRLLEAGLPDQLVVRKLQDEIALEASMRGAREVQSRDEVVRLSDVIFLRKKEGIDWRVGDSDEIDVLMRINKSRADAERSGCSCPFRVYFPYGVDFDDARAFGQELIGRVALPIDSQLIVVCTDAMVQDALKYGNVIFTDATHCISCKKGVKLITVMAVDEHGRGRHLLWAVVTSETTEVYEAIFRVLRHLVHDLQQRTGSDARWAPTTLMSDMAAEAFNAALRLWPQVVWLLCFWHVLKTLKLNLRKRITGAGAPVARNTIFNKLHAIMYHKVEAEARKLVEDVREELRKRRNGVHDPADALQYLECNFFGPDTFERWTLYARCDAPQLLADGSNARVNMILEAWHSILKVQIFGARRNKWIGRLLLELLNASRIFEHRRRVEAANFGTAPARSWNVKRGCIMTGFAPTTGGGVADSAPDTEFEPVLTYVAADDEDADGDDAGVSAEIDAADDEDCASLRGDSGADDDGAVDIAPEDGSSAECDGAQDGGGVGRPAAPPAAPPATPRSFEQLYDRMQYVLRAIADEQRSGRMVGGDARSVRVLEKMNHFCAALLPEITVMGVPPPLRALPSDTRPVAVRQCAFGARRVPPLRASVDDGAAAGPQPSPAPPAPAEEPAARDALPVLPDEQTKVERRLDFGMQNANARRAGKPFLMAVCLRAQEEFLAGADAQVTRQSAASSAHVAASPESAAVSCGVSADAAADDVAAGGRRRAGPGAANSESGPVEREIRGSAAGAMQRRRAALR